MVRRKVLELVEKSENEVIVYYMKNNPKYVRPQKS